MILLIDDDPSVIASLTLLLKQHGRRSMSARSPQEALELLALHPFELVVQDMNFSRSTTGEEGLELLSTIRSQHPELPVILITAWGSISLAVEGVKRGAADFISKPWTNQQLLSAMETTLSLQKDRKSDGRQKVTRSELDERFDLGFIVGDDPKLLRILELVGRVAPTDASVLIMGESGTGKELIAEAIHRNSRRRHAPFVKVNLGGISSTLFESEMFGHVRGAFTDARETRKGRFEIADGGTIFLDEIGEIDLNSQVKLLRVLQDRTYEVLGSSRTKTVDVRVISATNQPLPQLVERRAFREDLLYRLNLITINLPALRERPGDIPLLARHFLDGFSRSYGRQKVEMTDDAVAWLRAQAWPGNIRQLRQVLERAVLVSESDVLTARQFLTLTELQSRETRGGDLPEVGAMTLDEMERGMILKCIQHYQGNLSRVAEALGLSRQALYRRMEKYQIQA